LRTSISEQDLVALTAYMDGLPEEAPEEEGAPQARTKIKEEWPCNAFPAQLIDLHVTLPPKSNRKSEVDYEQWREENNNTPI